jgi:hypothetical protein
VKRVGVRFFSQREKNVVFDQIHKSWIFIQKATKRGPKEGRVSKTVSKNFSTHVFTYVVKPLVKMPFPQS